MEIILYPFTNIKLDNSTKILLDASFLLSLVYDDDIKHSECIEIFKKLITNKCTLLVTNIISAEVLNQIMYKIFMLDIQHKILKVNPFNTETNLREIINCFSKYDKRIIKDKRIDKLREIPYKKYFDNISKNSNRRNLLGIYYKTAVKMHSQLEKTVNFNYVEINKLSLTKTKDIMSTCLLSINDATHLAVCEQYNIHYILTLDSDFIYADTCPTHILKI